ncbi:rod shape-determining protein MreC [Lactobacillus kunkeei]|uniref:Cell shape-determining protein MreC n=1 Tax=Apilactobacillus kunkeei TaxID=148814 RepID=A0AAC8ZZ07_9LACO|nr:rod shape-determining protein MreC [Apilactobacillus kunkeei]ALJ32054.1 rod shape-determining protein MreC [Apilactobacillus kunkeei]KFJ14870.1 rod shape-determining protein MreC [Apilactobacillus kunkeei]NBI00035.1 rod shape-determining protein MreC [Apilactobacillus kunkeei]CAI2585465.1 Cell shape-determining protein MreC [Apilactobacillus kunkeei]CAI2585788.1 Cell shape-determining protein MreC [Apilactobacillus kunkeei]
MRKFFSNRKWLTAILIFIICLGFISVSVSTRNNKSMPPFIQRFGNDVVGIASWTVAVPANSVRHAGETVNNLINTYKENQKLKAQVETITATKVRDQAIQSENDQLKRELKIKSGLVDYNPIVAEALVRTPSAWNDQFVINKGSSVGVKKNMSVLGAKGLIGRVIEVNNSNSKVELISNTVDSDNKFPVEATNSKGETVNGIINGYDRKTGQLIVGHLNTKVKIKVNDKVSTNGLGGITPKGIYVGKVAKVTTDDYGTATKLYIQTPASMNDLEVVTVVDKTS